MSWLYRHVIRPALFSQESEVIHNQTLAALGWMSRSPVWSDLVASFCASPELPLTLWDLRFPNPVGLAAGMDKQAAAAPLWPAFGFGFSELGGVTRHPQPGNPAPRMFRAIADEALVNRMGFNNPGADAMAATLTHWKQAGRWPAHPVGINLGKSKITPIEEAASDYSYSFRSLWNLGDFFVVNVSSPNTPNLRQLQDKDALREILETLRSDNEERARATTGASTAGTKNPPLKPILVKVAPDLSFEALDDILELVSPCGLAGIVATNTTLARPDGDDPALRKIYAETGGLSGRPLRDRSTDVIRHLYSASKGRVPIVGVGGIFSAEDAWEKITAGASLVQVYSGLVYEGPGVARSIVQGLRQKVVEAGFDTIRQAVGSNAPA
ncbi:MAG: quinone-dependent dihydroorotate dehydrogenase [Verrucomicrobia bacterium]|nr:quinone-dependent dihydroorotate dehydrogenase [Verrucomicrobiota bacterium]